MHKKIPRFVVGCRW